MDLSTNLSTCLPIYLQPSLTLHHIQWLATTLSSSHLALPIHAAAVWTFSLLLSEVSKSLWFSLPRPFPSTVPLEALSTHQFIHLPISLSIYVSIYPPTYLPTYPFLHQVLGESLSPFQPLLARTQRYVCIYVNISYFAFPPYSPIHLPTYLPTHRARALHDIGLTDLAKELLVGR